MDLRTKEEAFKASKEFQKKVMIAKEVLQQKKSEADLRAYALESIVKHGSSLMSEEQKVGLVRDYVKMSGLDSGAKKDFVRTKSPSKRQRIQNEKGVEASPPQPATPPALPSPADAPAPAEEDEYIIYSDDDDLAELAHGLLVVDSDEPQAAKGTKRKQWTEEDDAALVAALRAGQSAGSMKIAGRPNSAAENHLHSARRNGWGSPALREYLEETCPEYVYKPLSERRVSNAWSEEEELTFIRAHKEGKTCKEIAAMLPGRTRTAVSVRWSEAKNGKCGTAALLAYAAECCKG